MGSFQINARYKLTANCLLTFADYIKPHLECGDVSLCETKLGSRFHYLVYKFNVCFIRLENPVYQNNSFIIYTGGQSSVQRTTLNQLNSTKHIFLIIFH